MSRNCNYTSPEKCHCTGPQKVGKTHAAGFNSFRLIQTSKNSKYRKSSWHWQSQLGCLMQNFQAVYLSVTQTDRHDAPLNPPKEGLLRYLILGYAITLCFCQIFATPLLLPFLSHFYETNINLFFCSMGTHPYCLYLNQTYNVLKENKTCKPVLKLLSAPSKSGRQDIIVVH